MRKEYRFTNEFHFKYFHVIFLLKFLFAWNWNIDQNIMTEILFLNRILIKNTKSNLTKILQYDFFERQEFGLKNKKETSIKNTKANFNWNYWLEFLFILIEFFFVKRILIKIFFCQIFLLKFLFYLAWNINQNIKEFQSKISLPDIEI